jgi:UDP-galactose transporter B1
VVERGINALVALVGVLAFGGSGVKIPHMEIFNSGISQMLAMAASNEALRYVSYPTQVLGKSGKMVPVMAGGILLGGKKYSMTEYAQVHSAPSRAERKRVRASFAALPASHCGFRS